MLINEQIKNDILSNSFVKIQQKIWADWVKFIIFYSGDQFRNILYKNFDSSEFSSMIEKYIDSRTRWKNYRKLQLRYILDREQLKLITPGTISHTRVKFKTRCSTCFSSFQTDEKEEKRVWEADKIKISIKF